MQIDVHIDVDHRPQTVLQALCDAKFVEYLTEMAGAELTDVTVNITDEGDVTLVARRNVPTDLIPTQARGFVGSAIEIRQVEAWSRPLEGEDGPRYGTAVLDISGAPVHAKGNTRLVPTERGSRLHYDLDVTSNVPLLGAMIERAVTETLSRIIGQLESALQTWLDSPS